MPIDRRPNLILITADSLRADFVGCVKGDRAPSLTPNLDQLGKQALVFTRARSQGPYTTMSMPSLFTGRYPSRLRPIPVESMHGMLVDGFPTVPEILARHGYFTAGLNSNAFLSRVFGFDKGFQFFYDDLFLPSRRVPLLVALLNEYLSRAVRVTPYLAAEGLNRRVRALAPRLRIPFFLWLHYMDTHGPYQSKRGFGYAAKVRGERLWRKAVKRPADVSAPERELLIRTYSEEVHYLDTALGDLFAFLHRQGLLENSAVFFTADHGEEFYEHSGYGHSHKLYSELIDVPLIVTHPGCVAKRIDRPVGLVDVVPTMLELGGIACAPYALDGRNLLETVGSLETNGRHLVSVADIKRKYHACVSNKRWKLIVDEGTGRRELYD